MASMTIEEAFDRATGAVLTDLNAYIDSLGIDGGEFVVATADEVVAILMNLVNGEQSVNDAVKSAMLSGFLSGVEFGEDRARNP